ncbi:hypothetical protein [Galbibacter orientalis]|uniref:Uncharacterized protein n=1 Tax=Galbibacter orientalis DSM 19592 TaxID=926559 RepID=I3C7M5_9FLAO|nr:hypothetical protein [Galbibacter orientalis]EIJ39618.1 hypothetical protein JoomaDRAFT_2646 [Galbibacter orientalis DSM 19592]|tara:strand:- start:233 stop:409 length:177 start_codon:yes stop_codon:yes gene_type:complete|eukprot:GDKH01007389.1.p1 GENE.GDKH01007389.1~~GDKH01007389.1.p1  ORF type:complete len:59 (+),score=8.91 GDKH01007389.1:43-219(+)
MDNPFKTIINNEKLPEAVRKKVMKDIDLIKLSLDVADLFVIKYPETITNILNLGDDND